ncbi:hypothetical protein HYU17_05730 [Candidatus Woesearchaeota archaeon]|nr:hypothetical protein [Candidatus Woesearchaeota archaeon]
MKPKAYRAAILAVFVLFSAAVIASGCTQQAVKKPVQAVQPANFTEAQLGSGFQLRFNETRLIRQGNIKVRFIGVSEDSRCPADVQCVWEGQAAVIVELAKDDESLGNFRLENRAGFDDLAIQAFSGHFVKLLKVEPYPTSKQRIKQQDYVIGLIVSKM